MSKQDSADAKLIDDLGGPAKVAELLGYTERGRVQRVFNWLKRGIPAKVKLERPDLFQRPTSAAGSQPPAIGPADRRGTQEDRRQRDVPIAFGNRRKGDRRDGATA
jgi:hypothetical protein